MALLRLLVACVGVGVAIAEKNRGQPCGPPPKPPYPPVSELANCSSFPDPFLKSDGTTVKTPAEWSGQHRKELLSLLEHYMYGHAPEPPPVRSKLTGTDDRAEYCERVKFGCNHAPSEMNVTGCAMRCLPLKIPQTLRNYTLRVGPSVEKTWPFDVFVYTPKGSTGPLPFVIYNGEGFFSGVEFGDLTAQGAKVLLDRGFGLALFNRNQLRKDHKTGGCATAGCSMGDPDGVQTLYPDNDWSTINVWAWGAARVIDFLLEDKTLSPLVDPKKLMTMGHSRGGKTALWHGAQDERVAITFPLMSGSSGNGAIRVPTPHTVGGDGDSQSVMNINRGFPYWFSKIYHNFSRGNDGASDTNSQAPWDQHFQRMLVAPRAQLGFEGVGNTHENPVGSQATYLAAQEIYNWLGVPGKIGSFWHPCAHPMNDNKSSPLCNRAQAKSEHDWEVCADFAGFIFSGKRPTNRQIYKFYKTAYPIQRPYAWTAPPPPPPPPPFATTAV